MASVDATVPEAMHCNGRPNAGQCTESTVPEGFPMSATPAVSKQHAEPFPRLGLSVQSSAALGWQGFGAELLHIPAGVHRIPAADHHRIGVHVGAPVKANCLCNGRRKPRIQAHGDADVVPAGLDGEWADEADCTLLRIWLGEAFVQDIVGRLDPKPSQAQIRPQFQLRDKRLEHLAWALRAELDANDASNALYAESLCTAIVVRLIEAAPAAGTRRRTLAPAMAVRVTDYIEAHLDQRLTLAQLAVVTHLSVPHFKVLFRETFGVPVHQYVVHRRVDRAKGLLVEGRLTVAQIALEVGFAHQSHLASWMNRLLGVPPGEISRHAARFRDEALQQDERV
jgi:AraC family transcriptional regulator